MAALLHDVIEDTSYNGDDIEQRFGKRVRTIVEECSDDKHKNKQQRKQAQIDLAPHKSIEAS
jgi:guanosine-3',5'-bis(diphosphate) 3'-pyrophosphohydrolase